MSNSLWPHESQHARPPCPSPTPRVYPNSCPSSRRYHPAISSSVIPFSSCPNPSQHLEVLSFVFSPEPKKRPPNCQSLPSLQNEWSWPWTQDRSFVGTESENQALTPPAAADYQLVLASGLTFNWEAWITTPWWMPSQGSLPTIISEQSMFISKSKTIVPGATPTDLVAVWRNRGGRIPLSASHPCCPLFPDTHVLVFLIYLHHSLYSSTLCSGKK